MNALLLLPCRLLFAVFVCLTPLLTAAPKPLWSLPLPGAATWHSLTRTGSLIVGTDDALLCVDPESGALLWKDESFKKTSSFNVREIEGTPVLIANNQHGLAGSRTSLVAVDAVTGKRLWEAPEIIGQYLGTVPAVEQGLVLLLISGHEEGEGNGTFIHAFELVTGKERWRTRYAGAGAITLHKGDSATLFSPRMDLSGHQEPVIKGDRMYLPYLGVHCLDLGSGKILWAVPFEAADRVNKRAYPALRIDGEQLFAGGGGEVYCIRLETGDLVWKSSRVAASGLKVWKDAVFSQIEVMGDRVFVRMGGNYSDGKEVVLKKPLGVLALDRATGHELWRAKDIDDGITNLLPLPEKDLLLCADGGNLIGIDAKAAAYTERFRVKIEFKRKMGGADVAKIGLGVLGGVTGLAKATLSSGKSRLDVPVALIRAGDKVGVAGKQHILCFDPVSQRIDWSLYYAAPSNAFATAAMFAVTALAAVGGNAQVAASGGIGSSGFSDGVSNIQGALDSYNRYTERVSQRIHSRQSESFSYILTNVEEAKHKDVGVVGVNLRTGDTDRQLALGEKEPDYQVDEATGRLFHFKDKTRIDAFQF
jgi:outer membrane protein assembly factor BamB